MILELLLGAVGVVGFIAIWIMILAIFWLKGLLTIPFKAKLHGNKIGVIAKGLYLEFIEIPKDADKVDRGLKDDKGDPLYWTLTKDSFILLPGNILCTFLIPEMAYSFRPDHFIRLSEELAKSHIENVINFGVKVQDRDGVERTIYPIDPKSPAFRLPKILTARNLAEQIKTEANKMKDTLMTEDKKPFYAVLTIGSIVVLGAVAIIMLKIGLDYNACKLVATSPTTTTLIQTATTLINNVNPPGIV